jgi:glycosyltransferase involved in cell wall biosynthesis
MDGPIKFDQGTKFDVSIVIPTKNEELTVGQFIDWCYEGFTKSNLTGEIILVDFSTDDTATIARSKGAQIVQITKPGLGVAYLEAKKYIQGRVVIMGDADCTYDFREIGKFYEKIEQGYDLVVGDRFRGNIEKHAMPLHHQYFGSPLTSTLFKSTLGIPTSDIHCGIRALKAELFMKLPFTESGWEYASEMIVASSNLGAKICEIPVNFYKEPEGRISHHKRNGFVSPIKAGIGTLRVIVTYSFDRIFILPGIFVGITFLFLCIIIAIAPQYFAVNFGVGIFFNTFLMIISITGFFLFAIGLLSKLIYNKKSKILKIFSRKKFSKRIFLSFLLLITAESISTVLVILNWISKYITSDKTSLNPISFDISSKFIALTGMTVVVLILTLLSLLSNYINITSEKKYTLN